VLITYEDEKSIKGKCKYIKKHKLAGIFFWEYFNDPKEYLINAIHKNLD
jgi:chitinase